MPPRAIIETPSVDLATGAERASVDALERLLEGCLLAIGAVFAAPAVLFIGATLLLRHAACWLLRRRSVRGEARLGAVLLIGGAVGFAVEVAVVALLQRQGVIEFPSNAGHVVVYGLIGMGVWSFWFVAAVQVWRLAANTWRLRRHAGTLIAGRAWVRIKRSLSLLVAATVILVTMLAIEAYMLGQAPSWLRLFDGTVP